MAKPWDEAMKKVVAASPQAFVDWLFPGGQFIELVNTELPKKTKEPLRSDNCLAMELDGQPCIAHLEFQSTQDKVSEMYDILQETPVYQFLTKEAREEGRQEGREEGRQEGGREALRQAIVEIVRKRFPKIVRLTRKQVAVVDDPVRLRKLVVDISVAQSVEEVTQLLLAIDEEEGE